MIREGFNKTLERPGFHSENPAFSVYFATHKICYCETKISYYEA